MISEERNRRRYIQQLKNKKRLADVKTKVKLTRKQKRLVDADSVIITNGITESQECKDISELNFSSFVVVLSLYLIMTVSVTC